MKVYLMTDLEGVAGVYQWENRGDTSLENNERRCLQRIWLAEEVNAAAQGFVDGGAREVWVNDGHGAGYTMDISRVNRGIRVFHGGQRPDYCTGLDEECAGLASVGTHAMAGTRFGNLSHTMGGSIRRYSLNGIDVGETGYQAFLAGHFGVPFIFCAGDAYACKEMEELVPGCVTVAVKEGLGTLSALTVHPLKAREMIAEGAQEAMRRVGDIKPLHLDPPIVFRCEYYQPTLDPENPPPGKRVLDSHTFEIEADDMVDFMNKMYGFDPNYRAIWKTDEKLAVSLLPDLEGSL